MPKRLVAEIVVRNGRREINPAAVDRLAKSFQEVGQLQPIVIKEDGVLIAGAHRLSAAAKLGWKQVECKVLKGDEIDAEMAEIDENLIREELDDAAVMSQTARRKELYEAKHPEVKHGARNSEAAQARWDGPSDASRRFGDLHVQPSFVEDTVAKTGKPERLVQRDVRIGQSFTEDQIRHLREGKVAKHELESLCRLGAETREAICEEPIASVRDKVKQALATLSKRKFSPIPATAGSYRPVSPQEMKSVPKATVTVGHPVKEAARKLFAFFGPQDSDLLRHYLGLEKEKNDRNHWNGHMSIAAAEAAGSPGDAPSRESLV